MKETIIAWAGVILFLYIVLTPNWGTTKHTIYEVYCPVLDGNLYDCFDGVRASSRTYLAIPETQTIIISRSASGVWKYENCTVFDAENWECDTQKYDALTVDKIMRNGSFTDLSEDSKKPKSRTALRIEYTIRKIIQFFTDIF